MARIRPTYTDWPTPAIELTDTPDPACIVCAGQGGIEVPDIGGESASTEYCDCWDPGRTFRLLPIPAWFAARWRGYRKPDPWTDSPF